ncbi:TatD family hydrolase [Streptomyces sp. SID13666]|uniref:TatD family hydrolase n=1 Tax=Streptomyces sp. SID13666 TaxID=2706054 RepID=UPI0013C1259D|nr:TatD family hydrolase [Streptomyces sp. SID13666]NEA60368.1 TatD family hydrolase [Streptomyces sp. SID13666]
MRSLPPIDLHTHVAPDIAPAELQVLNAVLFAATRTLDEAKQALQRADAATIWGVGCHPGLARAHKAFTATQFTDLITGTAYVSEIGLDGKSRVALDTQHATLESILTVLQDKPRIASIHSYAATDPVLDHLEQRPVSGAVLHWWLGTPSQTRRALDLGCYFSVNAAMLHDPERIAALPLDRILTETDHPFGDRASGTARRPGGVEPVEQALARTHQLGPQEIRARMWQNLARLVSTTRTGRLLPRGLRTVLAATP